MKTDFLKQLKQADNFTFTENGAIALNSTTNYVLDAFGTLGAMQYSSEEDILTTFSKAFATDQELAMRLLFYIRDIRGGQGMRRVFRIIARNLAFNYPQLVSKNLDNFLFFGRGDDVLYLLDTPVEKEVIKWISKVLEEDVSAVNKGEYPSLLAKWLPSQNASSELTKYFANKVVKGLGISPKEYRQMLSKLRAKIGIVESLMSQGNWEAIDFEKLPAKAAMIYSDAFTKHVEDNYVDYLKKLVSGDAKVNASSLFPVDIIHKVLGSSRRYLYGGVKRPLKDKYLLSAMWNALPDYFEGKEETGLCVVDTSGSMFGTPLEVALSLGTYCADKAKGPFRNHFFTFSARPKFQELVGNDICEKIDNINYDDWDSNTNIEAVFDLILETALNNNTPQEDLPSKLYIISDMQFDKCTSGNDGRQITFMQKMKERYAEHGYTMPSIIYWNVRASECGMFQETVDGENIAMVSGYSPSLFKSVIEGTEFVEEEVIVNGQVKKVEKQKIDPVNVMKTTLMNERYDRVITK